VSERIADRLFDAEIALAHADERFGDELSVWLGRKWWEPEPPLLDDYYYDYYDRSFELTGCLDDLAMPPESLPAIWAAGFDRFWLNHLDGTETAYAKGSPSGVRRPRPCPVSPRTSRRAELAKVTAERDEARRKADVLFAENGRLRKNSLHAVRRWMRGLADVMQAAEFEGADAAVAVFAELVKSSESARASVNRDAKPEK